MSYRKFHVASRNGTGKFSRWDICCAGDEDEDKDHSFQGLSAGTRTLGGVMSEQVTQ
jgi:hypothetical protein